MSSDLTKPRTAVPDAYGERDLWIGPCQGDNPSPGHVEIFASQVWCGDRVTLIDAMYEMAGLPAPVILDRPETLALDVLPGLRFAVNGTVIEAERPGGNWQLTPAAARRLAASLAVLADEAESELDAEPIRRMTEDLHEAGTGLKDAGLYRVARRLYRAGYRLEAKP